MLDNSIKTKKENNEKAIFLAAVISAFSITATYAQDAPKEKPKGEARQGGERRGGGYNAAEMYKDLNLTKEQETKLKDLNDEQGKKMQELRNDNSLSDDARREKMQEMRKDRMEKEGAILNKEQKEKLDAKRKERMERGGNRGPRENKQ
ncbi:hypothetical protein [Niabella hibiscisoli]|uniref:hypothetical protein n=1 Tax=Niabella hibiscisoli TaxID=1825928 RepID=UPI001F0FDEE8|nr:hypothetical protein [Niabella hibiscisoli]MCH5717134.1 hypothetical protein [Niabella hibiscisoli]